MDLHGINQIDDNKLRAHSPQFVIVYLLTSPTP